MIAISSLSSPCSCLSEQPLRMKSVLSGYVVWGCANLCRKTSYGNRNAKGIFTIIIKEIVTELKLVTFIYSNCFLMVESVWENPLTIVITHVTS